MSMRFTKIVKLLLFDSGRSKRNLTKRLILNRNNSVLHIVEINDQYLNTFGCVYISDTT